MYEEATVAQPGRDELIRWRASKPSNFFTALPDLVSIMELRMGRSPSPSLIEKLSTFGETVATVIEPAVQILERNREFPKLRPCLLYTSGHVMHRGPPRPRPSSLPSMVMTSMPARRSMVFVATLRS